jgi:site-specific recombinase XerC
MLDEILAPLNRNTPTILVTAYGKSFSATGLTMRMQEWTKQAGIEPGYTLHGLRKTLGGLMGEAEATTKEMMDVLGHDAIEHAELYSRSAAQKRTAISAMGKVVSLVQGGKRFG